MVNAQKILRILIIIAILITAYLLVLAWRDDYATAAPQSVAPPTTTVNNSTDIPVVSATPSVNTDVPTANIGTLNPAVGDIPVQTNTVHGNDWIDVTTDRYHLKIDPVGGDVIYAALLQYDETVDGDKPFVLLEQGLSSGRVYTAQSGLINLKEVEQSRPVYKSQRSSYRMASGQQTLSVPLTYQQDGVTVTKTYTFHANEYPIEVSYQIANQSQQAWQGQMFAQLKRDASDDPGLDNKGMLGLATYLGGAWGTPDDPYNKINLGDFQEDAINHTMQEGWVAMIQHYFVSAWIPHGYTATAYTRQVGSDYFIGFTSAPIQVAAGEQAKVSATLYAGPKRQSELSDLAVGLNQTVDYGVLWPISKLLFWALFYINGVVGNWGWAIVILTILVKIALLWFSSKSYYSMAKMRTIAPKMQALKDQHGDDRMAMSQAMMQMYKEEKVNPLAGCLPILMQMPIFLALYWVLVESVELRHAPWILWIQDLSSMDPWFILPIIMGASMYVMQMLNPQPQDPMQAKMMRLLPIIFTVFMLFFPAGLVLYWTVNNIFSMVQQYIITKKVEKEQAEKDGKKTVVLTGSEK